MNYILKMTLNDNADKMKILMEHCRNRQDYDSLAKDDQDDIDDIWHWFADNMSELTQSIAQLHETNMVYWLPVNGTVPPIPYTKYLLTDGITTVIGDVGIHVRVWFDMEGNIFHPTHYAETPVIGK